MPTNIQNLGLFKICRRRIEDQSARLEQPEIIDLFTLDATESLNYYTDQYSEVNMRIKHYKHFYIALCPEKILYDWFEMKDIRIWAYKLNHIVKTFGCILALIDGGGIDWYDNWYTGLIHPSNKGSYKNTD